MHITSTSDQSRYLNLKNANATIKQRLAKLTHEVTTGRQSDLALSLGGNTQGLSALQYRLTVLDSYKQNTTESAMRLEYAQAALTTMNDIASRTGVKLLDAAKQGSLTMTALLESASANLDHSISAINISWSGIFIFSGASPSEPSVVSSAELMENILPLVSNLTTAADVVAAIDSFFVAPQGGGGYLDTAVTGSLITSGPISIAAGRSINPNLTADSEPIRDLLRGNILALLAQQDIPELGTDQTAVLVEKAGTYLLNASAGLTEMQTRLGILESNVEQARIRNEGERNSVESAYSALVSADPFQASVALNETQTRLETLYAIISRLSRMSLAERL